MNSNLFSGIFTNIPKPTECPHCKSKEFIKFGTTKNNQRYKCKNKFCTKTFSDNTNKIWSYSKKDISLWKEYLNLLFKMHTLKECSEKLGITISIAHSWRIKILNALYLHKDKVLSGNIEIKKIIMKENFKGNRKNEVLPSTRERVFVATAKDSSNIFLVNTISKKTLLPENIKLKIINKVAPNSSFYTLGDNQLDKLIKTCLSIGRYTKRNSLYKRDSFYNRNFSNSREILLSFYKRLPIWLCYFNGVATKYLERYLTFYKFFYCVLTNTINYDLFSIITSGSYIKIQDYKAWGLSIE